MTLFSAGGSVCSTPGCYWIIEHPWTLKWLWLIGAYPFAAAMLMTLVVFVIAVVAIIFICAIRAGVDLYRIRRAR